MCRMFHHVRLLVVIEIVDQFDIRSVETEGDLPVAVTRIDQCPLNFP